MHLVPLQGDLIIRPVYLSIHPDPCKSFLIQILEELLVCPLFFPDKGCKDGYLPGAFLFNPFGYTLR